MIGSQAETAMWQDTAGFNFSGADLALDSQLHELADTGAISLISQLQTTLDLQQQLDIFAMHASRILPITALNLRTAQGHFAAAGSMAGQHQYHTELQLEQHLLGQLSYQSNHPFSPLVQRQLLLLESEWLYALRNALLVNRLQQMALKDPLTGLGNRRFFDDSYSKAIQLAKRHQQPFALLLLDLDNFKQVNDLSGHSTGDQVLLAVADCMRETLRATDSLFRFGGDEFALLLQDQDTDHAELIACRLQQKINQHPLLNLHQVGCSIGLAWLSAEQQGRDLFHQADEALYLAKTSGKGKVAAESLSVKGLNQPRSSISKVSAKLAAAS